ncbi:MAG: DUF362 domain-containing protein [Actinomycetota bacterium]
MNGKKSKVYFINSKQKKNRDLIKTIGDAFDKTGLFKKMQENDKTAVKMHFGEMGNFSSIRPVFIKKIVEKIKSYGGSPFLTDSNTLYYRKRHNAIDHLMTASTNGFNIGSMGAPIIIADGLRGKDFKTVKINGNYFKEVFIASSIFHADFIVAASHFTAHPLGGFGGAIKNLAMGGSAVKGKFQQHSEFVPGLKEDLCRLCGSCIETCNHGAIEKGDSSIYFISDNCVGCGECITECKYGAIHPKFKKEVKKLQEKMVEYLMGIVKEKEGKIVYINSLTDITPHCDCTSFSEVPFVSDQGILISGDPIAIDKASVDIINSAPFNTDSPYRKKGEGKDKFEIINEDVSWKYQISYGMEMGVGNSGYEIIEI